MSSLKELQRLGQAVWLDYIRRDMLVDGGLGRLIEEDGVTGVTSNPAIFQQAIEGSPLYDDQLRRLAGGTELPVEELYERLAVEDIRLAADLLRPVWERSGGADGYVSLEVSPHLAHDTGGSIDEARRLWQRVERPNLMIKIPATAAGIPAIEELLAEGINVNVTLMFSLRHYEDVAQAYLRGLARASDPGTLASVASFFVSRVDTSVDRALEARGGHEALALRGRIAVANSRLAYQRFREIFEGAPFAELRRRGARPQRVLWASTSTKNPSYRDVLYVEELIGPHTVNTVPPATLDAFRDHGRARPTLEGGAPAAAEELRRLAALGIDLDEITEELQREGVEKFARPFDRLLAVLGEKRAALLSPPAAERAS